MSHTVNPLVLRLGYKLNWTFLHNYIYISKTFRFTLLINSILMGFFRKYNYTLVKYFVNLETTKCKITVLALRNFGISRKLINFSFFKWTKGYKIAFFKLKRKFLHSIKHYKLKYLINKFDFNRFNSLKSILKNYNSNNKKKILLTYNNFKKFKLKRFYKYFYKKIFKYKLNDLFNNYNSFNLANNFFNFKVNNIKTYNFLNVYNVYNYYTLWSKLIISNLSGMHFLKSFDSKGFSPYWLKRYKFLNYFSSKSKLLFFNFINKKFSNNRIFDIFHDNNNNKFEVFLSFFYRFLKFRYISLINFNFLNYNLVNAMYTYLIKLKYILKILYNYDCFVNISNIKTNIIFIIFNKILYSFNKNYFFNNKYNFLKYYFKKFKYILKSTDKLYKKLNVSKKKKFKYNLLFNIFNVIDIKKKFSKPINNFYKTITYFSDTLEYDKKYFRRLKHKFVHNLRSDSHLYSKYGFPFSNSDALLYRLIHDSLLRENHLNSKLKTDYKNTEIKLYNSKKRRFFYFKFKKIMSNQFKKLFNFKFKTKKLNWSFFIKKIIKKINFFNKLFKKSRYYINSFNYYNNNFFASNFYSIFIKNIFLKLNKNVKFLNFFFNKDNFYEDNNLKLNIQANSTFLMFKSFIYNSKKLLFLVKNIYLKHYFSKNNFFNYFNLNNAKKISFINYNILSNIKLNMLNFFYFTNYNNDCIGSDIGLKFYYFHNTVNNNFNLLFKNKKYNILLSLFSFFSFEKFNLNSFFYRFRPFKYKRNITLDLYSYWFKDKKFFFFLEKELEKIFRINTNINIINPINEFLVSDFGLAHIRSMPFLLNKVYMHPKEKKNMVYFLIIFFLSLKLRATYLLSSYLTIMIEKREKHFEFFTVLKRVMSVISITEFNLSGLTIGLYGKVNGKDRAYRYFIHKFIKPSVRKQCMILNSELSHCYSRYGVFGVRIWMHEF